MRTHYEVLGVDPGTGLDEIRAAYRARARELHPDRRGGDAGAAREMAAVNEAWAVLRYRSSRAAYDASLAGTSPSAPGPSPVRPGHRPAFDGPAPGCLAGLGPWLAVLVVLAVIFVFTAYAATGGDEDEGTSGSSGGSTAATVRVRDLRGSCVRLIGGNAQVVDCFTVPNEGVIVAQASVGAACPDGTVEWLIRHQDVLACTEPGSEARGP